MRHFDARPVRDLFLVFDKGDDFGPTLIEFAKRNAIAAASLHAIGAFSDVTIAYWNRETKKYEEIAVREQVEVVSMTGNIAPSSEDIKLHAHVVLGKRDGSAVAGHFLRGIVFPTMEVFLTSREMSVQRAKDPETGLWLLERM
ncbi:MAG TPA: PPC domain-containing DNA-binding protein [Thermoanaerobaculia bacterium]|nr:PPC domain-containing DNA-binding protein [Thermoanaerobaculia bacterium]